MMQIRAIRLGIGLQRQRRVITALVACGLGLAAALFGGGIAADRMLREVRDLVRHHDASGEIQIVEIDADSLARIARWPFPRGEHGKLVDRLVASGVKSIAFDVDLSAYSTPAEDKKLAAALARSGGIVALPTFRQSASAGSDRMLENLPIPELRDHAFMAAVTIKPDSDGAIRSAPLGIVTAGSPRPSLAAIVAEVNAKADQYFQIDYSIDPATIPHHSFADVVSGRVPASALRGKRIIVGATAIEMGDRYAVPHYGVVPGVVIQALAAETLLQEGVPVAFGPALPLLIAIGAILALARFRRKTLRWSAYAAGMVLLTLGPLATEALFAASFQTAAALGAMLVAGLLEAGFFLLGSYTRRVLVNIETDLPNLAALELALADGGEVTLATAHVDGFAELAASLGPQRAADLVRQTAERLALATDGSLVYRTEESALAWRVASDRLDEVSDRFDAIAALMRAPVQCSGRPVDVSLHFGVASGPGETAAALAAGGVHAARRALATGTRWETYVADAEEDVDWRHSLLSELDKALEQGDVWVAYQPKFDIAKREIVGAEALVRWTHATRGLIRPDHFIPIAEESGRIEALTEYVLRRALADAAKAPRPIAVAVNVAANLLGKPGLVEMVEKALAETGISPERLTLEVTESAAMTNPDQAIATLDALAALGIKLSVDDYGTGQSTLTYLKRLPARELKIDKSFVQTIATSRSDAILVASTINLAHELGLGVVAEGVEDEACLAKLAELGCDIAQGYLIGKPMPFADFAAMLEQPSERKAA